jgi:hypothetical protein
MPNVIMLGVVMLSVTAPNGKVSIVNGIDQGPYYKKLPL